MDSCFHRGMLRRCLDFEMVGISKNLSNGSNTTVLPQLDDDTLKDKQLVALKPGTSAPRCVVPAIGLHLNALAAASKARNGEASSGKQRLKLSVPISSLNSVACQEPLMNSLEPASSDGGVDENEVQMNGNATQASLCLIDEELNQTSPKKKRHAL